MNGFDSPGVVWLLLAAQFVGVTSGCFARLSEGSACQSLSQRTFLVALALMGAATIVALAVGPGYWLGCSASLAAMVLTVTCDFRGSRESSTW